MHDLETSFSYIKYSFPHGPGKERVEGDILEINCQGWGHMVLRSRYGITLPSGYLSKEIYEDKGTYATTIADIRAIRPGAIFLFGPQYLNDPRKLHWALFTGLYGTGPEEPMLEHVNVVDRTIGTWPFTQFAQEPRYAVLYAMKQPIA